MFICLSHGFSAYCCFLNSSYFNLDILHEQTCCIWNVTLVQLKSNMYNLKENFSIHKMNSSLEPPFFFSSVCMPTTVILKWLSFLSPKEHFRITVVGFLSSNSVYMIPCPLPIPMQFWCPEAWPNFLTGESKSMVCRGGNSAWEYLLPGCSCIGQCQMW